MITNVTQRWRERRDSYRPLGEPIRTADYEVVQLDDDATPKAFVTRHHYSGTYPAARWRFGLYRHAELVGVAVFSHPSNDRVLTSIFPGAATESVELGRLVLLDDVPSNAETWMQARCREQLARVNLIGLVSFSDPERRERADGTVVHGGHVGTIYQASNAVYLGRGTARTLRLLPSGLAFNDRTAQKIRKRERGWEYAAAQLVGHGAAPLEPSEDAGAWLRLWLPRLTRPLRHPGNFKYAWMLDRRHRKHLPPSLPYPKLIKEVV